MKKKLKKGFTLVELVIVIAVIAILSAVLIPTFGNVISNAKDSAAMSEVSNAISQYTANQAANKQSSDLADGYIILFKSEQTLTGDDTYNAYKYDNISYVFSYNKGKLESVKFAKRTDPSVKDGDFTLVITAEGESAGTPVTLVYNGLTLGTGNSWTANGTIVLDGNVDNGNVDNSNVDNRALKGKIVLLTVKTASTGN